MLVDGLSNREADSRWKRSTAEGDGQRGVDPDVSGFCLFQLYEWLSKITAIQDDCLIAAQHFDSPCADVWQNNEEHHNWVQLPQSNATSTGLHEHAGTTPRRKRTNIWKTTNLQGRVTDAQLWSRILSMEEMVATTSCKTFPEGDLLPWNSQNWHLNTSRETATIEHLDLQWHRCDHLFW